MIIIKEGIKPDTTKRFECKYCRCIFEADKSECEDYDREGNYYMKCPCCGNIVAAARKPVYRGE